MLQNVIFLKHVYILRTTYLWNIPVALSPEPQASSASLQRASSCQSIKIMLMSYQNHSRADMPPFLSSEASVYHRKELISHSGLPALFISNTEPTPPFPCSKSITISFQCHGSFAIAIVIDILFLNFIGTWRTKKSSFLLAIHSQLLVFKPYLSRSQERESCVCDLSERNIGNYISVEKIWVLQK